MGLEGPGWVERLLQRLLLPVFVLSGAVVTSGFFFPEFVGFVIPGAWWLALSLLFFGTGLGYLAVLPVDAEAEVSEFDPRVLLRVRRRGLVGNVRTFMRPLDPVIVGASLLALVGFLTVHRVAPASTVESVDFLTRVITGHLGWAFPIVIGLTTVFCVVVLLTSVGDIRLGGPDATPTYTTPVYFTMVFTAGIAAGIVFWGPAEALFHYEMPPPLFADEPQSADAVSTAMTYTLFHWGFSAWSTYLALGLPIAYFVYERDAPLRVSAILTPFLGPDNLSSPPGKLVDILAVFATIGGITTSVALVAQQFLAGINFQWGVEIGALGPLLFVFGLSTIFVLSAQSGVHRGIRRIAVANLSLFVVFMGLLVAVGPRGAILEVGLPGISGYARHFGRMSAQLGGEWAAKWTIWNWVWWFSWAPFAGLFLAALSRGRRIRTVVLTSVVATGFASMAWFVLLGSTALHLQHVEGRPILQAIAAHPGGEAVAGFSVLEPLPVGELLIFLFLALIIVFITTSADTSTLVIGILASLDDRSPTTATIVFWGLIQGAAAVLVLWTESAELLQGAAVLTGGPFAIVTLIAMLGFARGLQDHQRPADTLLSRIRDALADIGQSDRGQ